jgi:YD repeat-containing protein
MIGYKATENMKCESLTYEVGKTYSINTMQMCVCGFHFCQDQKNVLKFYPMSKNFVLLEIEALGRIETIYDGLEPLKSVTDKLRVIRIVPPEEYTFEHYPIPIVKPIEYMKPIGNQNHSKICNGINGCYEYDSKGKLIYYKDVNGIESWRKYDPNGNNIYYENSNGIKIWRNYDSNGKEIHLKTTDRFEEWKEYDSNGNLIHHKDSDGFEKWNKYDSKGNLIHFKNSKGISWNITIE